MPPQMQFRPTLSKHLPKLRSYLLRAKVQFMKIRFVRRLTYGSDIGNLIFFDVNLLANLYNIHRSIIQKKCEVPTIPYFGGKYQEFLGSFKQKKQT